MPRHTVAYSEFIERLQEVSILRKKARRLEMSRHSFSFGFEIRALCRASVVLLSGHIEAYVKELGELTLDNLHSRGFPREKVAKSFFYYVSKGRIDAIRESVQPEVISTKVQEFVSADLAFWSDPVALPAPVVSDDFNRGFSNPKFDKVQSYLGRFGYTDFRRDFNRTLGRDAQTVLNVLDSIVNTRNAIAHGDPAATKTPTEIKEFEGQARVFCRVTDDVFAAWCRKSLCSIRT